MYAKIDFEIKKKMGVTANEYLLLQVISSLANFENNTHYGWCWASREKLGDYIDVSRISVNNMLNKLEDAGLIFKDEKTRWVKCTPKFANYFVKNEDYGCKESLQGVKKVYTECKESLQDGCKESLHNTNNSLYTNNNNNNATEQNFDKETKLKTKEQKFYDSLLPYTANYSKVMLREFYDYWTEPNKSKTQLRYEMESTWDLKKRLIRWSKNDFSKSKSTTTPSENLTNKINEREKIEQQTRELLARG